MLESNFLPFVPPRVKRSRTVLDPPAEESAGCEAQQRPEPSRGVLQSDDMRDGGRQPQIDTQKCLDTNAQKSTLSNTQAELTSIDPSKPIPLSELSLAVEPTIAEEPAVGQAAYAMPRAICNHTERIRNEAVRLASIACGKALRRAMAMNPSVIAAFVDDALAASGDPEGAVVYVSEEEVQAIKARTRCEAANDLEAGQVVVAVDGMRLDADIETRASLLVRAAAEA